jgi:acylphosphatase
LVSGIVQGVFFRQSTRSQAQRLGLGGWVRNLPDGRVEAVFEGGDNQVRGMVGWCHEGPDNARVSLVEAEYSSELDGLEDFTIR